MNTIHLYAIEMQYVTAFGTREPIVCMLSTEAMDAYCDLLLDVHFNFNLNVFQTIAKVVDIPEIVLRATLCGDKLTLAREIADLPQFADVKDIVTIDDSFTDNLQWHEVAPDKELEELLENC